MREVQRQSEAYPHHRTAMPAPPGHLDDQFKKNLMQGIDDPVTGGGFTMRDEPGDGPTSGTTVSLPKSEGHEEQKLQRPEVNGDNQADYINRKWDVVHSQPDQYAGGWDQGGPWYNDVSRNFHDPWEAAGYALGGGQDSVYDLDGYYDSQGGPSDVKTNQFFNDQIAKGGRRRQHAVPPGENPLRPA